RLLDAVPGRPRAGARLLHIAGRAGPRQAARAVADDAADRAGRLDPPDRPRLGGPRPRLTSPLPLGEGQVEGESWRGEAGHCRPRPGPRPHPGLLPRGEGTAWGPPTSSRFGRL